MDALVIFIFGKRYWLYTAFIIRRQDEFVY